VYHNTAAVIDADGSLMGVYRKMHIPDDPLFYEKFYFTPGDTGFIAWKTKVTTIGTLVCWDQWFPKGARLTAMQGAEILFYPTAIGWHPSERKQYGDGAARFVGSHAAQPRHRQRLLRVRAEPHRPRDHQGHQGQAGRQEWHRVLGPVVRGLARRKVVKRAPINKETVMVARLRISAKGRISRTLLAVPARVAASMLTGR
jgi:hypothetical protein